MTHKIHRHETTHIGLHALADSLWHKLTPSHREDTSYPNSDPP